MMWETPHAADTGVGRYMFPWGQVPVPALRCQAADTRVGCYMSSQGRPLWPP